MGELWVIAAGGSGGAGAPPVWWCAPFVALLLCVALLPLFKATEHWWHSNRNKLLVSLAASAAVLVHYATRDTGVHMHTDFGAGVMQTMGFTLSDPATAPGQHAHGPLTAPGWAGAAGSLVNALWEYLPFIVMLFSLYCVAGGIAVAGRLPCTPFANAMLLLVGGSLASLIGTTGASILLIRPLLHANYERKHRAHTVVFFIFIVSNIGGTMLPIGDPPLFLGFLRGVPFLWTLELWKPWLFTLCCVLVVYLAWDTLLYRREPPEARDVDKPERLRLLGTLNFAWLIGVVLAVALLAPGSVLPGTQWVVPPLLREGAMLVLVGLSFTFTPRGLRHANRFSFFPINEVAALFIGIFIALQVPLEILTERGGELGLSKAWHFFWATGGLSSFLDNAPTYAVFFQTALTSPSDPSARMITLLGGESVRHDLLEAVSLGAVFMGANTYIGNGPNFMVKSIAEERGVKMPGFFGYMGMAAAVLVPVFVLLSVLFL